MQKTLATGKLDTPPKKMLVVPLRYVGDTVVTVPLLRNIAEQWPETQVDVLTQGIGSALLTPSPYVSQCIPEPKGMKATVQLLKKNQYDGVLILRKSFTMALCAKLAGVKLLVGYDKQRFPWGYRRTGWLLDAAVSYPSLKTEQHQVEHHLKFLDAMGLNIKSKHLELWTTESDQQSVDQLFVEYGISASDKLAVVHMVSASHGKSAAVSQFIEAVRELDCLGYKIIGTGTAPDVELLDTLAKESGVALLNWAGKTSLREMVALYRHIEVLVTVDSGPIHIGAAVNVPKILGVFGPTNHLQWAPYSMVSEYQSLFIDLPCRPCYAKVCSHNNCKVQMTGSLVAEGLETLLKK